MFTGIIEATGKVTSLQDRRGQRQVTMQTPWKNLANGESIAVNGVCLTVTEPTAQGDARFFVSEETLERSNLKDFQEGSIVNLERSLTLEKGISGHLVQGHVDTTGTLINILPGSDHHKMSFALDPKYGRYCVEKGSIAINGVSLTINTQQLNKTGEFLISVLIIPHSWKNTNLSQLQVGAQVNIEVDVLAKYVERLCQHFIPPSSN